MIGRASSFDVLIPLGQTAPTGKPSLSDLTVRSRESRARLAHPATRTAEKVGGGKQNPQTSLRELTIGWGQPDPSKREARERALSDQAADRGGRGGHVQRPAGRGGWARSGWSGGRAWMRSRVGEGGRELALFVRSLLLLDLLSPEKSGQISSEHNLRLRIARRDVQLVVS